MRMTIHAHEHLCRVLPEIEKFPRGWPAGLGVVFGKCTGSHARRGRESEREREEGERGTLGTL